MRELTYRDALREALHQEMAQDETVLLIGEDVGRYGGAYKVTKGLWEEFGEGRVLDTPLAETGIAGAALGAALAGCRPVAEIMYIDFSFICMDQIFNQIAKIRYFCLLPRVVLPPLDHSINIFFRLSKSCLLIFLGLYLAGFSFSILTTFSFHLIVILTSHYPVQCRSHPI